MSSWQLCHLTIVGYYSMSHCPHTHTHKYPRDCHSSASILFNVKLNILNYVKLLSSLHMCNYAYVHIYDQLWSLAAAVHIKWKMINSVQGIVSTERASSICYSERELWAVRSEECWSLWSLWVKRWLVPFWTGGNLATLQLGHRDLTWTPTHFSYLSIYFNWMRGESKHGLLCQAGLDWNPSSSKEVCVHECACLCACSYIYSFLLFIKIWVFCDSLDYS